jgi:hypothetical protein
MIHRGHLVFNVICRAQIVITTSVCASTQTYVYQMSQPVDIVQYDRCRTTEQSCLKRVRMERALLPLAVRM